MNEAQRNEWIEKTTKMIAVMNEACYRAIQGEDPSLIVVRKSGSILRTTGPQWDWDGRLDTYSLKPKPKLRPWTTEEVLMLIAEGRQVINKSNRYNYVIDSVKLFPDSKQIGLVRINDTHLVYFTFEDLLAHWELLPKQPIGPPYPPCGVLE